MRSVWSGLVVPLLACVALAIQATPAGAQSVDSLAATGAAVAQADPLVAQARSRSADQSYLRGFDVATALFGDPSLGALGHTQQGPGSMGIRASLGAAGQRGFDASVALNLGRNYQRISGAVRPAQTATTTNRSSVIAKALPQKVPDVVGLTWLEAEDVLGKAGFTSKLVLESAPDPSVRYGQVRATVPAAGRLAPDNMVQLQIPRAASLVGIGALSLGDVQRRDGFDLDEGRYEEVYRGADIVLRKHVNAHDTGIYAEPSDGALLYQVLGSYTYSDFDDLGSFFVYSHCKDEVGKTPVASVRVDGRHSDDQAVICVLTSQHQLSAVQFRDSDNGGYSEATDYKFHHALFPPATPVASIGRGAPAASSPGPARPICDVAAGAPLRTSPAAPGLAARCREAGGPRPSAPPAPGGGPPQPAPDNAPPDPAPAPDADPNAPPP